MKARIFVGGILVCLVLVACSSGTESSAAPVTLKLNGSTFTSYAPIFIAEAEGFFEDEGIQLEYVPFNRPTEAVPLLVSGDLDIYAGSLNVGMLYVLGEEENVKVVADRGHVSPDDECVYHGLLYRTDLYESGAIQGPEDLAGRVIASARTGSTAFLLGTYLAQAGLTLDDVQLSDIPRTSFVDALENGTLDVVGGPELDITTVVQSGTAVLALSGSEVYGTYQSSILAFGERLLVEDRELGVRFLRAYLRGVQQYNEGKTDRNLEIMIEYTGESEETLLASCWVSINSDGWIDFDAGVSGFQQWSISQGQLDAPITEEQFWDSSLLRDVLDD